MDHYKVKSFDTRNFELYLNDQKFGSLIYPKWYSFDATIHLISGEVLPFESRGFWNPTVFLIRSGHDILSMSMGWKGIYINVSYDNSHRQFLLRNKGIWKYNFVLEDDKGVEFIDFKTEFTFSKMRYDYIINTHEAFDQIIEKEIILLTALHATNYYMCMVGTVV